MPARAKPVIEVLVVDDDETFRQVVTAVVDAEADLAVVGEAGDGDRARAMAVALVPDVVLLDVRMPGTSGVKAAQAITAALPTTRVIMLSASDEEDDLFNALRAGASGYVLKDATLDTVGVSIRAVVTGQAVVLSPSMAAKLVVEFADPNLAFPVARASTALSDRELEVLQLVAEGQAPPRIAERLYVSPHTVKRHLANILAKLHQRTRLDAVLYAQQQGILE